MNPGIAFEAARDATGSLGPATDPLPFAVAAALVAAIVLLLLLGGRAHREAEGSLGRLDGLLSSRERREGARND